MATLLLALAVLEFGSSAYVCEDIADGIYVAVFEGTTEGREEFRVVEILKGSKLERLSFARVDRPSAHGYASRDPMLPSRSGERALVFVRGDRMYLTGRHTDCGPVFESDHDGWVEMLPRDDTYFYRRVSSARTFLQIKGAGGARELLAAARSDDAGVRHAAWRLTNQLARGGDKALFTSLKAELVLRLGHDFRGRSMMHGLLLMESLQRRTDPDPQFQRLLASSLLTVLGDEVVPGSPIPLDFLCKHLKGTGTGARCPKTPDGRNARPSPEGIRRSQQILSGGVSDASLGD